MKSTYRVLFFIRKSRVNKDGLATVNTRITIDGDALEFSAKLSVNASLWNPIGRMNGRTKEAREINDTLDKMRADLKSHYDNLYDRDGYVTPEKLRDSYLGIEIQQYTLLMLYNKKVDQKQNLVGKTIQETTLLKYIATQRRMADFLQHQYKKDDIPVRDVNFDFILNYETYLKSVCGCGHNSSVKHLRFLKQILSDALKNRYITHDPFQNYQLSYKPVDKEYLLEKEIKKIMMQKFHTKRLEEVRDVFLFQIFTGLAYIDAANLSSENIQEDEFGQKWIRLYRQKSSVQANIPLLEVPQLILHKYKGLSEDKLLPIHTNQKMNEYLKEIANLCGIKKRLSTHCGRHTFATIMLTKGVSIESVSKMLGHTNITTTQIYARILNQKIRKEVNLVRSEFDAFQEYYRQAK